MTLGNGAPRVKEVVDAAGVGNFGNGIVHLEADNPQMLQLMRRVQ